MCGCSSGEENPDQLYPHVRPLLAIPPKADIGGGRGKMCIRPLFLSPEQEVATVVASLSASQT